MILSLATITGENGKWGIVVDEDGVQIDGYLMTDSERVALITALQRFDWVTDWNYRMRAEAIRRWGETMGGVA